MKKQISDPEAVLLKAKKQAELKKNKRLVGALSVKHLGNYQGFRQA